MNPWTRLDKEVVLTTGNRPVNFKTDTMTTEQKAIELLKTRIDTMETQINDGLVDYSYEDLIDFIECSKFLLQVRGVKYDTRKAVELSHYKLSTTIC